MGDTTVIYYTSNREREGFESKVQQELGKAIGGLPLISVSQKPIKFGKNICVGDIGATPENVLIQIREGARAADTTFVSTAEADCLYHKSYYDFKPKKENVIYRSDCFYVLWLEYPKYFHYKKRMEIGGITGRKYLIRIINNLLSKPFTHLSHEVNKVANSEEFTPKIPMISLKTRRGMHYKTPYIQKKNMLELPYWGTAYEVAKEYTVV